MLRHNVGSVGKDGSVECLKVAVRFDGPAKNAFEMVFVGSLQQSVFPLYLIPCLPHSQCNEREICSMDVH